MYLRQGLLPSSFSSGLCATTPIAVCSRLLGVWVCTRGKEPPRLTMDGSVMNAYLYLVLDLENGSIDHRQLLPVPSTPHMVSIYLGCVHAINVSTVVSPRAELEQRSLFSPPCWGRERDTAAAAAFQNINSTRRVPWYLPRSCTWQPVVSFAGWHAGRQGPYVPSLPWGLCHGTMYMGYSGE